MKKFYALFRDKEKIYEELKQLLLPDQSGENDLMQAY